MAFNKVRYVTFCQQFLTTAVVLATGVTAAGVLTLEIESPQQSIQSQRTPTQEHGPAKSGNERPSHRQARQQTAPAPTPVDVRPVEPKVREVAVASVEEKPAAPRQPQAAVTDQPRQQGKAPAQPENPAADPAVRDGVASDRSIVAVSKPEKVSGYATVGVTWREGSPVDEDDLLIEVRTQDDGRWSGWSEAEFHDDHAPDAAEGDSSRDQRPGTDALVIGDVDEVQMRATSRSGQSPEDVNLAIIDPGVGKQVEEAPEIDSAALASSDLPSSEGPISLSSSVTAPKPYIYSRAQWGANERMRDGRPRYGTIQTGFVHHTVNANNYSASQVPALIRGIYAYHTQSRGWSDIGYNFLVDRFGRIWEGRYGGVTRAVVGAHTRGYNERSFAMSAIGNFDITQPPAVMLDAYARLFAWKLSLHDIQANTSRIYVKNKYFDAINGHRDAGSTACPGRYLYAKLSTIRSKAQAIQTTGQVPTPAEPAYDPTQEPGPAVAQPAGLPFPAAFNLAGSATPDVVAAQGNSIKVFRSSGGFTGFGAASVMGPEWDEVTSRAVVGDLNRDGRPDMLVRKRGGSARVVTVTRSGRTATLRGSGTRAFRFYAHVAGVGDLNRDGKADVVGRHYGTKALALFPGRGNGRFKPPVLLSRTLAAKATGLWTAGNIVGDWRPDLIMRERGGDLFVVAGRRGGLGAKVRLPKMPGASFLGVGNLDAQGGRDLVFAKGSDLYALQGAGGKFSSDPFGPIAGPAGLARRQVYNVGGSGHADVLGFRREGNPVVALHNGRRAFSRVITAASGIQTPKAVMSVGDWNNDGKNDVITRHGASGDRLILRLGKGDGTLARGKPMSGGWKTVTEMAALGDVTGDGKPDLVGRIGSSGMRVWPGDGKQGFLKPQWANRYMKTFGRLGTGTWRTFQVPDTIIRSRDGNFVPLGGAPTTTTARARLIQPGSDVVIGIGDMTGDGASDLVVREEGTGALWLLHGLRQYNGGVSTRTYLGNGFGGFSALG